MKRAVIEVLDSLPDECSWDDVMYELYVRQKIERGLNDAEEDRLVDHDEVFAEFER